MIDTLQGPFVAGTKLKVVKVLRQVCQVLRWTGVDVTRYPKEPQCGVLQPWSEKEQLKRVLERPLQYSLVTADRMFMLLQWLSYAPAAPGDIARNLVPGRKGARFF